MVDNPFASLVHFIQITISLSIFVLLVGATVIGVSVLNPQRVNAPSQNQGQVAGVQTVQPVLLETERSTLNISQNLLGDNTIQVDILLPHLKQNEGRIYLGELINASTLSRAIEPAIRVSGHSHEAIDVTLFAENAAFELEDNSENYFVLEPESQETIELTFESEQPIHFPIKVTLTL